MRGHIRTAGKLDYGHGTALALHRDVAVIPGAFIHIQLPYLK
jgi:hypothetical protein